MKKIVFLLGVVLLPMLSNSESCGQLMSFDKSGKPTVADRLVTIGSYQAKVYEKDRTQMRDTGTYLNFNEKYKVEGRTKRYFKLKKNGEDRGYVKIDDLFCGGTPMTADSGLLEKFYVKTEIHEKGTPSFVTAYPSSEGKDCGESGEYCKKLKRFNSYFVYKEKDGRYLLASSADFKNRDYLTGWVDKKSGYIWKTAIGARPSEKLTDKHPVYFYKTLEDAESKRNGNSILGGDRWFNIPIRMPVLNKVEHNGKSYYEVALSLSGIGVKRDKNGNIIYTSIKNDTSKTFDKYTFVDIMFLIDGTESMQSYLNKITAPGGIIEKLSTKLKNNEKYKGLTFRISYRVYRDSYAGKMNLGEGHALDTKSCKQNFIKLKKVNATKNDAAHGDMTSKENLYGGIGKAIEDMESCKKNKKIMVIIGDTGDNYDSNTKFNKLIKKLKAETSRNEKNTLMVFIQTPKKKNGSDKYNEAYASFNAQADKFAHALDSKDRGIVTKFQSDDSNLISKILKSKTIKGYLDTVTIDRIKKNLKNGENLTEVIEKLRKQTENTIPAVYFDEILDGSCKDLGKEACEGKVFNIVMKGYIEATPNIKEDVFFNDGDFDKLTRLMNNLNLNSTQSKEGARISLVNALKSTLGKVTGQDFLGEAEDMKIEDFLQSNGIPTRENSPLFKYKIYELLDMSSSSKIQDCNAKQLFNWLLTSKEILKIVGRNKIPTLVPMDITGCDKKIPKYDGPIMSKFFPNNVSGYAYQDEAQGLRYLWVPKEFLP